MLFEMDVLQRSRSSYNPTVSFRVYAIRVCSPRGVLTGPPRGRSPPLLCYPGSPHGGASVARPKMAPALPLTSLSHTALSIVSLAFIPASSPISCIPTHSGALETSLSCTFPPEFFNLPRYFGYAYRATCTCPFCLPPSFLLVLFILSTSISSSGDTVFLLLLCSTCILFFQSPSPQRAFPSVS